ncbi:hypothetical protein K470DRAFT_256343 [Piedraia hortae CBS 480.64]|uniref:Uncharacterized protein n=1 Tax=Piedraia hortae CBS 480.64 TaxID=1314780 RepID=A0A6A7C4V6_9PEZI|nr:hypothetical protein K470DRAFT_256343 [Piedraia hortae CBS 480.64]
MFGNPTPIQSAPSPILRSILLTLCEDPSTLTKALNPLNTTTRKRKASEEAEICAQCQDSFYESENRKRKC